MTLSELVDSFDEPALAIDLAGPRICAANERAREIWGLAGESRMPVQLDGRMPAIASLAALEGADCRSLVFWTGRGAQRLACICRRLPAPAKDAAGDVVLVRLHVASDQLQPAGRHETGEEALPISDACLDQAATGYDMRAIAHELRTPIGAIIAFAEMIENEQLGPIGDPRYREYARDIRDSANLSLGIVSRVLEREAGDDGLLHGGFQPTDLADVVAACLRTVQPAAKDAAVSLDSEMAEKLPKVIANQPALKQVILNLLTNAIKFTPPGGKVTLSGGRDADGRVVLEIRDTGVGMSEKAASVLFSQDDTGSLSAPEPSRSPGRGIGFSLVRRLAAAMHVGFEMTSERGRGTSVRLAFQAHKVAAAEIAGRQE